MGFNQIKVELCDSWGGDRNMANAAWASSYSKEKAEERSVEDVHRVVRNLVNLHHDTPKERVWMEFFVTFPIYSERQYDKYRMSIQYQNFVVEWLEAPMGRDCITQNELSGRYRTIPDRPYTMPKDVGDILEEHDIEDPHDHGMYSLILESQHTYYQECLNRLKEKQKEGRITNTQYKRAREVLRGVLGTAYLTDMRIVMNMNAFEHIINQRIAEDTQMESRVFAYRMVQEMRKNDVCVHALEKMVDANGWQPLLDEVEAAIEADLA